MKNIQQLHLYEEVLLLALRDKEGTIFFRTHYKFALGGALLSELILKERVKLTGKSKNKFVEIVSPKKTGDILLDECLKRIATAKRRARIQTWINRFSSIRNLRNRIAKQLCRKKILKLEESKVLFFFTQRKYPEINPKPEREITDRISEAIFTNTSEIEPRTIILVSIANETGLLKVNFDKKELKSKKDRIKSITSGELIGEAAKHAIQAVQAAIAVTVIIPAVTSAATSH